MRCAQCAGLVHIRCRDITRTCYGCRWKQARAGGLADGMLAPASAGPEPFAANVPATVSSGLPVPPVASPEARHGASANEVRVLTAAVWAGWRITEREEFGGTVLLRKHGRGYLRLTFATNGRIVHAATQRKYLTPTTTRITRYLEEK
ncbi:hypothetical protein ABZ313_23875 [Streptomyces sp. NPDC006251]|uniref:hypothetical protein n=1 Tax=Streptomyces sp. NPDC006251 TaxID=3155718 RepID=UPI0033B93378